jgi:hypothetical protein
MTDSPSKKDIQFVDLSVNKTDKAEDLKQKEEDEANKEVFIDLNL